MGAKACTCCHEAKETLWSVLRPIECLPILGHLLAALYMICNKRDQAERSALKATIGIFPVPIFGIINFFAEIGDESGRKRSPRLRTTDLTPRPSWMSNFQNSRLRELCLPATHQSGTCQLKKLRQIPLIIGWSRCQELTIGEQLQGGVRFLDLRLMSHEDGEIYCHHNVVIGATFSQVLEEVREFVSNYSTEIIGLNITNDGQNLDWGKVNSKIESILGGRVIPEYMKDRTIVEMTSAGKNIALFGAWAISHSWRNLSSRWPNKQLPSQLKQDMEEELRKGGRHGLFWYKAECTPDAFMIARNIGGIIGTIVSKWCDEKFEFLRDLTEAANHEVLEVLRTCNWLPFNVICTDFVQDEVVGCIIELNRSRRKFSFEPASMRVEVETSI